MAKLKIEELAEMVADTVLDKFEYKGKTIREWVQNIAEADHVGTWIPCREMLPKKGKQVLCCNKNGSVFTSAVTYISSGGYANFGQHFDVVAWMPLPEPYKAESEEKGMIKEWYSNWECDDEIICPYCGKKYEPSYEETFIGGEPVECYKEGEQGEFTCDECGKKFSLSAEMKWEYTTETIEEEMTEEEHDEMVGKA